MVSDSFILSSVQLQGSVLNVFSLSEVYLLEL